MNRLQTIASYLPSRGCVVAARNAVSFSTVFIVALLFLTAGNSPVFGHATACGNINNEKVFVNALYSDILGRDPDREGFRLRRNKIIECGTNANCLDKVRANLTLEVFSLNEFRTRTKISPNLPEENRRRQMELVRKSNVLKTPEHNMQSQEPNR